LKTNRIITIASLGLLIYIFPFWFNKEFSSCCTQILKTSEMKQMFGGQQCGASTCGCLYAICNYCPIPGQPCIMCTLLSQWNWDCKEYTGTGHCTKSKIEGGCGDRWDFGTCNNFHACQGGIIKRDKGCDQTIASNICPELIRDCDF